MATETLGSFRHGHFPDVFLDATRDLGNLQLIKAHEGVHRVLEYSSAHGLFLTFLIQLTRKDSVGNRLPHEWGALADVMHHVEFHVQEGCANFLTLNMCMAGFGQDQADILRDSLPEDYLEATSLFSNCLRSTQSSPELGPYVVKNLEFLVTAIALASLNTTICIEFESPKRFNEMRLRKFLRSDAPSLRLHRLQEHFLKSNNAERFVRFAADEVNKFFGPHIRIFDQEFMREYMNAKPAEWEDLHRKLEREMRRKLVAWIDSERVIKIDPSYDRSFDEVSEWSPVKLITQWERDLDVKTDLTAELQRGLHVTFEQHLGEVHSVNYSLSDKRKVLVPQSDPSGRKIIEKLGKAATHAVCRLIYIPRGNDIPEMGIVDKHRYVADFAFYQSTVGLDGTLRLDGLTCDDLQKLVLLGITIDFVMTHYNFLQMNSDDVQENRVDGMFPVYVYFVPAAFDVFEYLRSNSSKFQLSRSGPFSVSRDWASEVVIPGVIAIHEYAGRQTRSFFCVADDMLMRAYWDQLARAPNVSVSEQLEVDRLQRCAMEASYGIDSVLDRCSGTVYAV